MLHLFFFFNDTATTEIYTLSLHDALPISLAGRRRHQGIRGRLQPPAAAAGQSDGLDRKSTRLNSSHQIISYAVFCLKKKKNKKTDKISVGSKHMSGDGRVVLSRSYASNAY